MAARNELELNGENALGRAAHALAEQLLSKLDKAIRITGLEAENHIQPFVCGFSVW
jgi:hypothetical protein